MAAENTGRGSLLADQRLEAFDRTDCTNGPDEEGNWPCDPKVAFGGGWAECQACGRVAEWKPVCGFCKGKPVGDAASWIDGKPRPPLPCPRCGETAA